MQRDSNVGKSGSVEAFQFLGNILIANFRDGLQEASLSNKYNL